MDELRGHIPKFVPVSQLFKQPDHWLHQKEEQMTFTGHFKEPTYIPPKPVVPIFKKKPELNQQEPVQQEPHPATSTTTSEFDESEEDEAEDDEYSSEYEHSMDAEIESEPQPDDTLSHSSTAEPSRPEVQVPNFGSPPSLVDICLQVLANNFSTISKYVKYFPEATIKRFGSFIDLKTVDVGLAARALHEESFWKRMTESRWIGYHKPWAHGKSWKIYFLQKYLAEVIARTNPDDPRMRTLLRLVRRIKNWIYALDIKQLSAPPWPSAVDVDSSTDTGADTGDELSVRSDMTLTQYLNRHINFFRHALTTDRLPLKPMFQKLIYLTHLTFSFGFDNYHLQRDYKFSRISDEDASNLAQAIASCRSLYCFKLTRSRINPKHLETIIFGLSELAFIKEVEFSHLCLTDEHMVAITALLLMTNQIKILCLKNNNIGSDGFIRLLHALVLRDCRLKILDVSTNPAIGDAGGVAMAALLAKKKRFLKRVFMAGTGLTHVSGYNFGVVLYFNKTLEVLDLSVNKFTDFAAEALLRGLEHNYTLKRLDVTECGIPFPTVREMERICFNNADTARKRKYVFPVVHPTDFWSGFRELDAELVEDIEKPKKTDEECAEEEDAVTKELLQIFVWATVQMKPRNRLILVRDIHAFMKKTNFVTGFDAVIERLILNKEKEIINKAKIESKREREEKMDSSIADFSAIDFQRKSSEKTRSDFLELEAMQVLKDVNRCGRIDELFKSVKSERIDGILKHIGKTLDADTELLSSAGINLPFAKKWYKGFPEPESESKSQNEEDETEGDEEEEEEIDYEEVQENEDDAPIVDHRVSSLVGSKVSSEKKLSLVKSLSQLKKSEGESSIRDGSVRHTLSPNSGTIGEGNTRQRSTSNIRNLSPKATLTSSSVPFFDEAAFQAARDKYLGIRTKYRKWPKDGPPQFPKVVPYELIKDCHENLPDTEPEAEDDFPYWLDQWVQKF